MSNPNNLIAMGDSQLLPNEIDAAVSVLKSGMLRQGKQCQAFEQAFADKVGAKYAVACANGSASLHLSYMTFIEPGNEVLVPSFTFIATGSMVLAAGAKPVICDVDPQTFLIDLDDAANRITEKTVAISPVNLFGNVCDIEAVQRFADKHHLKIVWDNAQCHGATYKGKDVGSFGDFASYSFYPSKNMFVGEGGMVLTNDHDVAKQLRSLREHGQTDKYYHTMLGLNYRMTDVEAAIGQAQLKRLDKMVQIRRQYADYYNQAFSDLAGVQLQKVLPDVESAVHQYCFLIDENEVGVSRQQFINQMLQSGISTGIHYPRGMHQQPLFIEHCGQQSLPVSERLAQQIIAIPVHHALTQQQVEYIASVVRNILS